ncbi:hypothetical protein [Streptomyces ureilyticus]|uniref:Transposase n=1 Tax=Streptomyces ureilyticus TaxID=1775131 RepID=A0ABX0DTM1_9ACTN|nr:hypothetical protein [Streptomyces ureilyticus]NGO45266.1 hypothetical protein [Streptomyces ureilyticus]
MGTLNTRKAVRGGTEPDVEAVLDELYATPPSAFVARREELAAAAKTAGRVEDARRIHAARRPTLAAWAANLLLRSQPEESQQFLELGRALREAYRTLDTTGIKELSAQRRRIVFALSQQAARFAQEAGHRLSDTVQQDVESTLRAVLADPDAADRWASGRLESALTPSSEFPSGTAPAPAARAPQKPARQTAPPPTARTRTKADELAERRRQKQERLDQARRAAEEAAQRLRDKRAEQADADAVLQRARDRYAQAQQQVAAAEQQLQQARKELQRADHEQDEAGKRSHAAADARTQAEQAARDAAQEVKRLTPRST